MANDFLSSLKDAAGLSAPVCEKFKEHDIDRDLFIILTVSFMKEVLELTPYDIMKVKTFQAKLKVESRSTKPASRQVSPASSESDGSKSAGSEGDDLDDTSSNSRKRRKVDESSHSSEQRKGDTTPHSSTEQQEVEEANDSTDNSQQSLNSPPLQDQRKQKVTPSQNSKPSSSLTRKAPTSNQKPLCLSSGPSSKNQTHQKAPQSSHNINSSMSGKAGTLTANKEESRQRRERENCLSDSESDKENSGDDEFVTDSDLDNAVKEFKADPEPSFASLKQSLPKFDVISILHKEMKGAHSRFKASFVELLQKKHLDRTKRLCIIRKLTGYLYLQHASSPQEVTPSMKEGMAKSFCIVFPKFANLDDKHQPWSTLFSPKGPAGFIANASRAFMREYPKRTNKPTKKRKAQDSTSPEMDDADIEALGIMDSGRNEKPEILDGMAKCFEVREAERARGESITFFMKKYPQFNKYGGEVLSEEFQRLRPQAEDMCKVLLKLQPKILSLNLRREVNLPMEDDGIKALVILSQHLPHDIPRRNEKVTCSWADLKDVLVVLKPSESVEGYVLRRIEKARTPIQPYLIFVRGQVDQNRIMKIFIVLDSELCAVDTTSSIKAIDWLFKCYFIFNVNYPFGWRNTFHLLQTCFYKILEHQGKKKDKVNSSEFELFSKIRS